MMFHAKVEAVISTVELLNSTLKPYLFIRKESSWFQRSFIHTYIHIYISLFLYIYIYVKKKFLFSVVGLKREKSKFFKMNRSTKRFEFFKNYLFCSYIHIYYKLVLTYVYITSLLLSSENLCDTRPYEWGTQWDSNSLNLHEWVWVSLGAQFIWPCAT